MVTRNWTGSGGNDWFTGTSWEPDGVPASGDDAIVSKGTANITGPQAVGGVHIALGSDMFATPAHLLVNKGTVTADSAITVGTHSPYADLVLRDASFAATVTVSGGQLNYFADTALTSSGTIAIEKGGSANITGLASSAAPAVTFLDDNGTLILTNPAAYTGTIAGLRSGDRIELGHGVIVESVSYANDQLELFDQNGSLIATLNVSLQGAPVLFFVQPFGHGASAITTSQETRIWGGATDGNWFDAANWTNGIPLGGDTVSFIRGGGVIDEATAKTHGVLDFLTVQLGAAGGFEPVTLHTVNTAFGAGFNLQSLGTPQYTPNYIAPQATFIAAGETRFEGNLLATSHGGTLTVDIETSGTTAHFILAGQPGAADADLFAEAFAGQESTLVFTGAGTLTNNGRVLVDGVAEIDSGIIVQGDGSIEIQAGGSVIIDGTVAATQSVVFSDETGHLTINNIGAFQGEVLLFGAPGDQIEIGGVQATSLAYDPSNHLLTLIGNSGTLGQFEVTSPLGLTAADFALNSDDEGGSVLTYQPDTPLTMRESLPIAAVGTTGATIPLSDLLTGAFGSVPVGYAEYTLSAPQPLMATESYWEQGPYQPINSVWLHNGTAITRTVTIDPAEIDEYSLLVGNSIVRTAWFTVPNAESNGEISQYVQYNIWTVNPAVSETGITDPLGPRFGQVYPSDIVASALRYNDVYNGVLNYNNCNWIADNVTAGAGAVMPYDNASTDPADNQEGGFWRIVYRGSDQTNPAADWFPLTQPGDVVRMGRIDGGGQHTTTVIGTVNPDGTITVYDNGDHNAAGQNIIGIHDPTYWTGTDPASITIYRLDARFEYLITGSGLTEFLQGSVYHDLIRPSGGADTVAGGPGHNIVQGLISQIDGISVIDFHGGDALDLTNLAPASASAEYDVTSGSLSIRSDGSLVASVALPAGLTEPFLVFPDATGGTYVATPCFAAGTRIATPRGPVAVEHLAVGDRVLTVRGDAAPIVWLGHRHVDCRRHPRPSQVWPVRISAAAFGPGRPTRDLLLSPDHAVFVDGALIPVKYLIDDDVIAQVEVAAVTYWHVELPRHDVVLAEGLPTESYLDNGGRANFGNGGDVAAIWPDFSTLAWEAQGCAPLCITGPVVQAVRTRLRREKVRRAA